MSKQCVFYHCIGPHTKYYRSWGNNPQSIIINHLLRKKMITVVRHIPIPVSHISCKFLPIQVIKFAPQRLFSSIPVRRRDIARYDENKLKMGHITVPDYRIINSVNPGIFSRVMTNREVGYDVDVDHTQGSTTWDKQNMYKLSSHF